MGLVAACVSSQRHGTTGASPVENTGLQCSEGHRVKLRIAIVDDDAESCSALGELLTADGFEVSCFESGEAAWSALKSRELQPDVVVADVRMPGLDGVGLLQQIKTHFASMPVVLLSAFADEAVWVEGIQKGAFDVFPKPIQGTGLVRALRKAVGVAQG